LEKLLTNKNSEANRERTSGSRFQFCPKESYLIAVKYITKYLKGIIGMGLWYPKIG